MGLAATIRNLVIATDSGGTHSEKRLIRDLAREPLTDLTTIETQDQNGQPVVMTAGMIGQAYLLKSAVDTPCQVRSGEGTPQSVRLPEPAAQLPLVFGAELVGTETIGGVQTTHYHFDERALRRYQDVKAAGDVWVAQDGGWVVHYDLRLEANGVVQVYTYKLSDVNALTEPALPDGCSLPLDLPAPDNAKELVRLPGTISFLTSNSVQVVAAFYEQALVAQGYQKVNVFEPAAGGMTLVFQSQVEQTQNVVSITLTPADTGIQVIAQKVEERGFANGMNSGRIYRKATALPSSLAGCSFSFTVHRPLGFGGCFASSTVRQEVYVFQAPNIA